MRIHWSSNPAISNNGSHVIEYGRSQIPNGPIRVNTPKGNTKPRPARADELQYIKKDW